jgi:hypothetical protein
MTYGTPGIVVSGVPHPVVEVEGQEPAELDQFIGERTFVVERNGSRYQVAGAGSLVEGAVRFHEKVMGGHGKDVRVWTVTTSQDGFVAEPG